MIWAIIALGAAGRHKHRPAAAVFQEGIMDRHGPMSAFWRKADIGLAGPEWPLLTQSGQPRHQQLALARNGDLGLASI